jgi:hypothetical protein
VSAVIIACPDFSTIQNVFLATVHQLEAFKLFAITLENALAFKTLLVNDAINA